MLKTAKKSVLALSKMFGLFRLVGSSRWRQQHLLVLCYHSISMDDEHEWDPRMYMDPKLFESRMRALATHGASVLPFASALEMLRNGSLPPRSIAITFDDGTADFHARVLPILEKYRFPALVYLTTYFTAHQVPVYHLICPYMLWKARHRTLNVRELIGEDATFHLQRAAERDRLAQAMHSHVRKRGFTQKQRMEHLGRLADVLQLDFGDIVRKRIIQLMTPEEVRDITRRGIDVQLHTHRHRTPRDLQAFTREIVQNREEILRMTAQTPLHFCYPSGIVHPEFPAWLRECGVATATTCESGLVAKDTEPLLIPRVVDVASLSPLEFESWICGASAFLPRR